MELHCEGSAYRQAGRRAGRLVHTTNHSAKQLEDILKFLVTFWGCFRSETKFFDFHKEKMSFYADFKCSSFNHHFFNRPSVAGAVL